MVEEWQNFVHPMAFNESNRGPLKDSHHMGHEEYVAFDTNQFIQVPEGNDQKDEMEDENPLDGVALPMLWKGDPSQPMIETVF